MLIETTNNGTTSLVQIDGASELNTDALPRTGPNVGHFRSHMASARSGSSWYMGNQASIERAIYEGWPDGLARVQRLADELREQMPAPKSYKRRQRWSEDGDEPSWEREQYGATDIWRTSKRDVMTGPTTVELCAPWGGSAFRNAEQLQWDGVVLTVLIDLLEQAGYRVGASLNYASTWGGLFGGGQDQIVQVIVKHPQSPLDLATLVPVAAHPGVVRCFGIGAISLASFDVGGGHGRPVEIEAVRKNGLIPQSSIILKHAYSESDARREIQRVLDMFQHGHPHHHTAQGALR